MEPIKSFEVESHEHNNRKGQEEFLFMAMVNGQMRGNLQVFGPIYTELGKFKAFSVDVDEEYRGQNIATEMYLRSCTTLQELGESKVIAIIRQNNKASIALHKNTLQGEFVGTSSHSATRHLTLAEQREILSQMGLEDTPENRRKIPDIICDNYEIDLQRVARITRSDSGHHAYAYDDFSHGIHMDAPI